MKLRASLVTVNLFLFSWLVRNLGADAVLPSRRLPSPLSFVDAI